MHPGIGVDSLSRDRVRSELELGWRWLLVVGWLVLSVVVLTTGERDATWHDLRVAVTAGDVTEVSTSTGPGPVEITWRDGLVRHRTTVIEDRRVPDVDAALTAVQPGLTIEHHHARSTSATVAGWRVSNWLLGLSLVLSILTLLLLVTQPPTWRATRWAWFWLLGCVPPIGLAAYLLLSGPTGVVPAPRDPRRRLTGGWAFLLAFVVSSLSDAVVLGLT